MAPETQKWPSLHSCLLPPGTHASLPALVPTFSLYSCLPFSLHLGLSLPYTLPQLLTYVASAQNPQNAKRGGKSLGSTPRRTNTKTGTRL